MSEEREADGSSDGASLPAGVENELGFGVIAPNGLEHLQVGTHSFCGLALFVLRKHRAKTELKMGSHWSERQDSACTDAPGGRSTATRSQ